jgi:hypothetical protein
MPTVLTNLVPDAYVAMNVVSRELTGLIASAKRMPSVERLAIGQSLRSPVVRVNTAGKDIVPSMTPPAAAEQTVDNVPFVLSKSRAFPFTWSGEDQTSANAGPGALTIAQDQIAEAIRAAVREISADGWAAARVRASRAFGTAGTTPFGTNLGESAQVRKILDDNGAPPSARSLVIDTTAGAAMRTLLNSPLNANSGLNVDVTRQGVLLDINNFAIREEAQIGQVTKGTGASYLVNNGGGYAAGATAITVDTGTGTILAGDVITFAGDTNRYVVATALASNVVTLQAPGLRRAVADNAAITVGNDYTANLAFSDNALVVGTRLPASPMGGDAAILRETLIDPRTGLAFELCAYPGYKMIHYEIGIAWGWAVEKPEHLALLLG